MPRLCCRHLTDTRAATHRQSERILEEKARTLTQLMPPLEDHHKALEAEERRRQAEADEKRRAQELEAERQWLALVL